METNCLNFIFPIDGDVLTPDDGVLNNDRLTVTVKVKAPFGKTVYICEQKALMTSDGIYSADITLDGYRNALDAYCVESNEKNVIYVYRFKAAYGKYRLAIDDIIWSMEELALKKDIYNSIFDCKFFRLFYDLHEAYETKVHMNIYYETESGFNLTMFPDKYKTEFISNSDWLKFTFHARSNEPGHIYQNAPYSELIHDYHLVNNEILRFAGPEVMNTNVNGLHYAETTIEGARALRAVGIKCLVGYYIFDSEGNPSISYYLNKEQTLHAAGRDFWVDNKEDIIFSKDKMVIDTFKIENIVPRLNDIKINHPHEAGTMNFVTHEQYFYNYYSAYQPDYADKIKTAVRWATENNYKPVFLSDVIVEDYPY